ncbi:tRNA methyltransferase 61 isoform X2 [Rhynchophorus ferrugineus]|uniref:tRNA methyltransferase 61 isoform X2 n=1 Tax=Rhynchophorus ferrugineus TaxID=354439 RepID=UPI003FCC5896
MTRHLKNTDKYKLEISPGSIVIESGTGSGSLSHALIRAIKPHGHLYTFDFHEVRTKTALQEFKEHGLDNYVSVNHRDVCTNGFGDELNGKADAVFLDLPHPWLAIHHSIKSLKETGGRICSFSPCIEQVQKTCQELSNLGFQEIQTMEVLQTQYNVQTRSIPVLDMEFLKTPKLENVEKKERDTIKFNTAVQPAQQPGHTGYLTFGTLYPIWARKVRISLDGDCDEIDS